MPDVRPAAVAGMFYPEAAPVLAAEVRAHLARAEARPPETRAAPKAIIAPHAGYVYSGPIAAAAYARLAAARETIRRVVLLGPDAPRAGPRARAVAGAGASRRRSARCALDRGGRRWRWRCPRSSSDAAHALEHSLEVQLPFLQRCSGSFAIVPFAVGDATRRRSGRGLELLWGGPETLIVVSSDLSHYHPYADARGSIVRPATPSSR